MSPEFRQQVEALYHSALRIDPLKRPSFLDEACGQNSSLRLEVESLLSAHDLETARSRSASSEVPTEILGQKPRPLAGQSIAHYKILSPLGRGGMGAVYRARQRSLNRTVALKVLAPALASDPVALARFRREISALARCDHPNPRTRCAFAIASIRALCKLCQPF